MPTMRHRVLAATVVALACGTAASQSLAPASKVRADAVTIMGPTVPGSFCSTAEVAVFHCSTGAKQVSVCASRTATPQSGSLQYRFGKRGQTPEIQLPAKPTPPSRSASADTLSFSGGGGAWLRFRSGEFAYTVYTAVGRWGPNGEPRESEGLVVERGGKTVATLRCKESAQSELGPALYGKLALTAASADEYFEVPPPEASR
jgi:hypothetical protein